MPFQSGNLSGRNNTTGLDTFQPPLSLDGGPDVLLDYFSLYAAFSFALQRPDAFTSSQISQSFTIISTAESKTCMRNSDFISHISMHFQLQKITTPTYAYRFSTFVWEGKSSRVCQEFSEICVELLSVRIREHF